MWTSSHSLIAGLIAAIFISSVATNRIRSASLELDSPLRDRVLRAEDKWARLWRAAEFLGFALIIVGMFHVPIVSALYTKHSQRLLTIAGGVALFCIANALSAWFANAIYAREAPGTNARKAAFSGAILVTLSEVLLLSIVFWIVGDRLYWFDAKPRSTDTAVETADEEPSSKDKSEKDEKGVWIDESIALKELAKLDRDYIQAMVERGALRTKQLNGKTLYNATDVEKLKNKKQDVIPD